MTHTSTQWTDVGRPVAPGIVTAAHLAALTVLPSGVWRILLGLGLSMGFSETYLKGSEMPGWGTLSMVMLTVLTEALALLTIGLVRPWGEVVPRWVPGLRGRRIPPLAVTIPATLGGLVLTAMWIFAIAGLFSGRNEEMPDGGWHLLLMACYLPALLWGPLLLWVTWAYQRRRR